MTENQTKLGNPQYFKHYVTAKGLVSRESAIAASRNTDDVLVWSRGQAGVEIFYQGKRYIAHEEPHA